MFSVHGGERDSSSLIINAGPGSHLLLFLKYENKLAKRDQPQVVSSSGFSGVTHETRFRYGNKNSRNMVIGFNFKTDIIY